jgi:hypothetical protein
MCAVHYNLYLYILLRFYVTREKFTVIQFANSFTYYNKFANFCNLLVIYLWLMAISVAQDTM